MSKQTMNTGLPSGKNLLYQAKTVGRRKGMKKLSLQEVLELTLLNW